ncbi:MarR family winged helix-turn-helix transcriptional regulator [Nocardia sp. NBC_00881]|uniref:MarR family winged helix-turn-helix transcriptional regulator n=1 Tax=Nocardia sp. NBC_00881 TaxID=2975995 RepID=UPI00386EE178
MTRTIKRLEHAGFVRRLPCADDKRVSIIEPTTASLVLRHEVERVWFELEQSVSGNLTTDEQSEAIDLLAQIEESLIRATAQGAQRSAAADLHPPVSTTSERPQ